MPASDQLLGIGYLAVLTRGFRRPPPGLGIDRPDAVAGAPAGPLHSLDHSIPADDAVRP